VFPPGETGCLDPLIAPRSIAFVGASSDPRRIGGRAIAYMLSQGFRGAIYPVNPARAEIQGLKAYTDVRDLPEVPDVGIIAVPAAAAVKAIDDLGRLGVRAVVMFTAGFAELGQAGIAAQEALVVCARRHGMRLLGPNSLGIFNARIRYYATFSASFESGWPLAGRIALASQSGAFGTHIFATARRRGIGIPLAIMTGNEADVSIGDAIEWLAHDPETDVIVTYAEGIKDAPRFLAGLDAARISRKPVVMMKVGTSVLGGNAAQSHTAAIAGSDEVADAVLREYGVVRAANTEQLLDIAYTATRRIYPVNNTLGVITISGGAGVLIADVAAELGLAMPEMPVEAQQTLKEAVPFAATRNPVDCTAQVLNDLSLIGCFTDTVAREGGYSSILAFFTQTGGAPSIFPALSTQLQQTRAKHPDRLFVLSVVASPEIVRKYEADGFIVFEDPTRATVAIHAMGRFGQAFAKGPAALPPIVPTIAFPRRTPDEATAKSLLAKAGISIVPEIACATVEEALAASDRLGYPVALKILSPDILHKSEIGGVLLGVAEEAGVREGFVLLLARARSHHPNARVNGVLVAQQITGGVECILGVSRDPVFGPIAMFGLGGVFVEILKDVAFRRCPFGEDSARELIMQIRGAPLLLGARGRPKADIEALSSMLAKLSVIAAQAGSELASIDLNPVFAMPEGHGAHVADAVIEMSSADD
jgi:acyl-CoA synthetase (NDP forming)